MAQRMPAPELRATVASAVSSAADRIILLFTVSNLRIRAWDPIGRAAGDSMRGPAW
jgi:hypothetical protein